MYTAETSKTYEGTKRLKAWPATRGEYNAYRGWTVPHDEDATEPGYLVEYEEGGNANHPNHSGYVSWSPASVFDGVYKEVSTDWRVRVQQEADALNTKLQALETFLASPGYDGLPLDQRVLLRDQARYMAFYAQTLAERLNVEA